MTPSYSTSSGHVAASRALPGNESNPVGRGGGSDHGFEVDHVDFDSVYLCHLRRRWRPSRRRGRVPDRKLDHPGDRTSREDRSRELRRLVAPGLVGIGEPTLVAASAIRVSEDLAELIDPGVAERESGRHLIDDLPTEVVGVGVVAGQEQSERFGEGPQPFGLDNDPLTFEYSQPRVAEGGIGILSRPGHRRSPAADRRAVGCTR